MRVRSFKIKLTFGLTFGFGGFAAIGAAPELRTHPERNTYGSWA